MFGNTKEHWCHEIAMRGSKLHDELAAEEFAAEWFVDYIGCKELLCPIGGRCQALYIFTNPEPGWIIHPDLFMGSTIKVRDALAQFQVVKRQILRQAQFIGSVDRHCIVDHVCGAVALCWHEDKHAQPILWMHGRSYVLFN